ncbi:hypothetical protein [Streptomyces sp. SBT349]|uniref:hypothetical protein n=1 Tax=Streptomyces sp. SBT349 TaxID=1580539 RepID=UPI00066DA471|nr:hypothetical protein [Streptomyces sp. SBT349]
MNPRLLDRALATAAARAAAPGGLRFTERQLYYELCRVLVPLHLLPRRLPFTLAAPLRYERFAAALGRREAPPGLLTRPPRRRPRPMDQVAGPVLGDEGPPRLLVCQDPSIARMLIANGWHREAACTVLAADDLPLDPWLATALGGAPDATVHVLHDASAAGTALPGRIRAQLGAEGPRVAPLGLTPRHAAALHLVRGRAPGPVLPAPDLDQRELRWLAGGRFAEVAAVNPGRLLRTLHRLLGDTSGLAWPAR